jgi:hypothetical protein
MTPAATLARERHALPVYGHDTVPRRQRARGLFRRHLEHTSALVRGGLRR